MDLSPVRKVNLVIIQVIIQNFLSLKDHERKGYVTKLMDFQFIVVIELRFIQEQ